MARKRAMSNYRNPEREQLLQVSNPTDQLTWYFDQIRDKPILTKEQETDLFIRIEPFRKIEAKKSCLIVDKRRILFLEKQMIEARQHIIECNLRWVIRLAQYHLREGIDLLDLIQEGNLGLMKAVSMFDYRRGFKFSTYATWWIRQHITRALPELLRMIRVPDYVNLEIKKIHKIVTQSLNETGHEPTIEQIMEATGFSEEQILFLQNLAMAPRSLDAPYNEQEELNLGEFIEDPNSQTDFEEVEQLDHKATIDRLFARLTIAEQAVISLRYGLVDGKTRNLREVGVVRNLSRERIRQIEEKAMKKLRTPEKSIVEVRYKMTFCICCPVPTPTEATCRACSVSVCLDCLEDGLCPVCERLALHRRERALFVKQWNQITVKLPATEKHWTAKLTKDCCPNCQQNHVKAMKPQK